ncbi:HEAT repeat domain-containing protein [Nocardiopsis sp. RSe5-2]|uniref:HEAT repeat domain-containing protein n=1 Tax=Nocardiopsis endophytica TaxID=3018445 RepID=A0ABT4UB04_9ACTN|nr:HEAT repeat domain-containing protein [Nocardiopsis endophytica]MDA2814150.1 HEAT repeat domain-containing protein [Nocardiopsis endophytica]
MDTTHSPGRTAQHGRKAAALSAGETSVRLQAALAAGSSPDPALLETLVERCAVEPDFFVRDMLAWALLRLPAERTLPRIRRELGSERPQARSQALHLLSKIGEEGTRTWITRDLLHDANDQVARTAWRVAAVLVPEDAEEEKERLAGELVQELGRGDRGVRLSLSRALADLGEVVAPLLEKAAEDSDPVVAAHARATERLRQDPESGFDAAVEEAERVVALGPERAAAAAAAVASVDSGRTEVQTETVEAGTSDAGTSDAGTAVPAVPAVPADGADATGPAATPGDQEC